ncbi:MAG: energy transducer TonB [Acidobacteriia bacterium]|nr:energy transducer TonB [Terriglobia bacterium]
MGTKHFLILAVCIALSAVALAQSDQPVKQRVRVSPGVSQGLKTHDVTPQYPHEAREKGIQGDVILGATIDEKGNVAALKLLQGDPILAKAAIEAVKQWNSGPTC